jgi:hypothetical protein
MLSILLRAKGNAVFAVVRSSPFASTVAMLVVIIGYSLALVYPQYLSLPDWMILRRSQVIALLATIFGILAFPSKNLRVFALIFGTKRLETLALAISYLTVNHFLKLVVLILVSFPLYLIGKDVIGFLWDATSATIAFVAFYLTSISRKGVIILSGSLVLVGSIMVVPVALFSLTFFMFGLAYLLLSIVLFDVSAKGKQQARAKKHKNVSKTVVSIIRVTFLLKNKFSSVFVWFGIAIATSYVLLSEGQMAADLRISFLILSGVSVLGVMAYSEQMDSFNFRFMLLNFPSRYRAWGMVMLSPICLIYLVEGGVLVRLLSVLEPWQFFVTVLTSVFQTGYFLFGFWLSRRRGIPRSIFIFLEYLVHTLAFFALAPLYLIVIVTAAIVRMYRVRKGFYSICLEKK